MSNKLNYLDKKGLAKVFSILKFGHKKIWHGTLAEWEALSADEKAKYDQAEVIDEYTGVPVVVDKVEAGNLNPVTSNAVAEALSSAVIEQTFPDYTFIEGTNDQIMGSITLTKGKWIVVGQVNAPSEAKLRSFAITTGSAAFQTTAFQLIYNGAGGNLTRIIDVTSDSLTVNLTGFCAGTVETWGELRLTAIRVA